MKHRSQDFVEPESGDNDERRQSELEHHTETNFVRRLLGCCPAAPESIAVFHFSALQWVASRAEQEARQVVPHPFGIGTGSGCFRTNGSQRRLSYGVEADSV